MEGRSGGGSQFLRPSDHAPESTGPVLCLLPKDTTASAASLSVRCCQERAASSRASLLYKAGVHVASVASATLSPLLFPQEQQRPMLLWPGCR